MRNIASEEGLTKNTRLREIALVGQNTVRVKKFSNNGKECMIYLKLNSNPRFLCLGSFAMLRNHLPLVFDLVNH